MQIFKGQLVFKSKNTWGRDVEVLNQLAHHSKVLQGGRKNHLLRIEVESSETRSAFPV